jgi:hypothetical protein
MSYTSGRALAAISIMAAMAGTSGATPPNTWPEPDDGTWTWGETSQRLFWQPYSPLQGPADTIIEVPDGTQDLGPVQLPFPVDLGDGPVALLHVNALGYLSTEPMPFLASTPSDTLWAVDRTQVAVAVIAHRRRAARFVELRTRGPAGARTLSVAFIWTGDGEGPDASNGYIRFDERTGDLLFGLSPAAPGPFLDAQSASGGAFLATAGGLIGHRAAVPLAILGRNPMSVSVTDCDPRIRRRDRDVDTIPDACDTCPGHFDPRDLDSDRDGLGDACDPDPFAHRTAEPPSDPDSDLDGVPHGTDNCPFVPNADQADGDRDGTGDACDACPADTFEYDGDGDGICRADNCPADANPDQADADGDGVGDACDFCEGPPGPRSLEWPAADGDDVCAEVDNCVGSFNPRQEDRDADGVGDACDPHPDLADAPDHDGIVAAVDVCPDDHDPAQEDTDGNGAGDVCDPDQDGDGVPNDVDLCPFIADPEQSDAEGDGLGDACDVGNLVLELLHPPAEEDIECRVWLGGETTWFSLPADPGGAVDEVHLTSLLRARGLLLNPDACEPFGFVCYTPTRWAVEMAWVAVTWTNAEGQTRRFCLFDGKNNPAPRCERRNPYKLPAGARPTMDPTDNSLVFYDEDGLGPGLGDGCAADNCPGTDNIDQADRDRDGLGDACDSCPDIFDPGQRDTDRDQVADACDNCPAEVNPDQADLDGDGLGDRCDPCVAVRSNPTDDRDRDGVDSACDNCPAKWNPTQSDGDLDRHGDACDNCPRAPNPSQSDKDGDGPGDACDRYAGPGVVPRRR